MAFVNFKDYNGGSIDLNPALVQSVSNYDHFDHDMELPAEFYFENSKGLKEVRRDRADEADRLRVSPRTIVTSQGASFIVQGSVDDVKKALSK